MSLISTPSESAVPLGSGSQELCGPGGAQAAAAQYPQAMAVKTSAVACQRNFHMRCDMGTPPIAGLNPARCGKLKESHRRIEMCRFFGLDFTTRPRLVNLVRGILRGRREKELKEPRKRSRAVGSLFIRERGVYPSGVTRTPGGDRRSGSVLNEAAWNGSLRESRRIQRLASDDRAML